MRKGEEEDGEADAISHKRRGASGLSATPAKGSDRKRRRSKKEASEVEKEKEKNDDDHKDSVSAGIEGNRTGAKEVTLFHTPCNMSTELPTQKWAISFQK